MGLSRTYEIPVWVDAATTRSVWVDLTPTERQPTISWPAEDGARTRNAPSNADSRRIVELARACGMTDVPQMHVKVYFPDHRDEWDPHLAYKGIDLAIVKALMSFQGAPVLAGPVPCGLWMRRTFWSNQLNAEWYPRSPLPSRAAPIEETPTKEKNSMARTWTDDEIRDGVMDYEYGCDSGKTQFLRDVFDIEVCTTETIEVTLSITYPSRDDSALENSESDLESALQSHDVLRSIAAHMASSARFDDFEIEIV